uniref:Uncharacterized protein n=1 Tax=Anguilla anguilla TaxID=7936 RepID=A0A0E9RVI1_ANGAN
MNIIVHREPVTHTSCVCQDPFVGQVS